MAWNSWGRSGTGKSPDRSIGRPSPVSASLVPCCWPSAARGLGTVWPAPWKTPAGRFGTPFCGCKAKGFPKSADVGKLIDKAKGAKREVVGTKLGQPGYSLADNGRTNEVYGDLHNPAAECAITAPATDLAKQWTGWAFALKPAWEPIILAMRPLDGTIAHNAEKHGVAGMNIDACRIGENPGYKYNADQQRHDFPRQARRADQADGRESRRPIYRGHQGPLARQPAL